MLAHLRITPDPASDGRSELVTPDGGAERPVPARRSVETRRPMVHPAEEVN